MTNHGHMTPTLTNQTSERDRAVTMDIKNNSQPQYEVNLMMELPTQIGDSSANLSPQLSFRVPCSVAEYRVSCRHE